MKTIRMTAIRTEKARSRTQESAFQMPERTALADAAASSDGGVGLKSSCIPGRYFIIDGPAATAVPPCAYDRTNPRPTLLVRLNNRFPLSLTRRDRQGADGRDTGTTACLPPPFTHLLQ